MSMRNFILFFFLTFYLNIVGFSQKQQTIEGIYKGGICVDGAICGTWLLKSDGTFTFLDFQGNYLKHIGQGKFYMVNDTIINFHFEENQLPIIEKSEIHYSSKSERSYDSSYITGQLKDHQNNSISYASIIINGQFNIFSDSLGKFEFVLPRLKVIPNNLVVLKKVSGFNTINVSLSQSNNYHILNITMSLADSATCLPAFDLNPLSGKLLSSNEPLSLRVNRVAAIKAGYASITSTNETKEGIIGKLSNAKQVQSYLSSNIDQLIAVIDQ